MRRLNRDEIFEVLILQHTDFLSFSEAIAKVMGRPPEIEEIKLADETIAGMRHGWVQMNLNIRSIPLKRESA